MPDEIGDKEQGRLEAINERNRLERSLVKIKADIRAHEEEPEAYEREKGWFRKALYNRDRIEQEVVQLNRKINALSREIRLTQTNHEAVAFRDVSRMELGPGIYSYLMAKAEILLRERDDGDDEEAESTPTSELGAVDGDD